MSLLKIQRARVSLGDYRVEIVTRLLSKGFLLDTDEFWDETTLNWKPLGDWPGKTMWMDREVLPEMENSMAKINLKVVPLENFIDPLPPAPLLSAYTRTQEISTESITPEIPLLYFNENEPVLSQEEALRHIREEAEKEMESCRIVINRWEDLLENSALHPEEIQKIRQELQYERQVLADIKADMEEEIAEVSSPLSDDEIEAVTRSEKSEIKKKGCLGRLFFCGAGSAGLAGAAWHLLKFSF